MLQPSCVAIRDPAELAHLKRKLWSIWGITPKSQCPSANPVSMSRSCLEIIRRDEYVASLKADGVRYMLLLTMSTPDASGHLAPQAVMIDRRMCMFEVSIWAPTHMFAMGSVFDGELVLDTQAYWS